MATDTETWAAIIELVELLDDEDTGSSSTYVTNYQGLVDVLKGNRMARVIPTLDEHRRRKASLFDPEILRQLFRPFLEEFADIYDWPVNASTAADAELLRLLREQMTADSDSLNSNGHTLDTSFSGSTTGTGVFYRLTVDADGNTIEGVLPAGAQTFECIRDARGGDGGRASEHAEVFQYQGLARDRDFLSWTGTGVTQTLTSANASDSLPFLRNPSFDEGVSGQTDDTTGTSSIFPSGWAANSDPGNFAIRKGSSVTYRGRVGLPAIADNYALEINANDYVEQLLQNERPGLAFRSDVPYHVGYAAIKQDSGDGTLTGTFGGTNDGGQTVSGLSSWTHIPITTGANCWFANWNQNALNLRFTLGSNTTGSVIVDDIIIKPYSWIPGLGWVVAVGGGTTWVKGDTKSLTDAIGGTRARVSWWLARAYMDLIPQIEGWFPTDAGGSETIDSGN